MRTRQLGQRIKHCQPQCQNTLGIQEHRDKPKATMTCANERATTQGTHSILGGWGMPRTAPSCLPRTCFSLSHTISDALECKPRFLAQLASSRSTPEWQSPVLSTSSTLMAPSQASPLCSHMYTTPFLCAFLSSWLTPCFHVSASFLFP